jgi:hypothetical protein
VQNEEKSAVSNFAAAILQFALCILNSNFKIQE